MFQRRFRTLLLEFQFDFFNDAIVARNGNRLIELINNPIITTSIKRVIM